MYLITWARLKRWTIVELLFITNFSYDFNFLNKFTLENIRYTNKKNPSMFFVWKKKNY